MIKKTHLILIRSYLASTWRLLTFNMASTYPQHGVYLPSTWRLLSLNMASTYLFNQYYTIRFLFCHVLTGYMIINSSSSLILDYLSIYHSKQSVTRQRYFPLVLTYRLNNSCPWFMNMYSEAQGEAEDYEYSKAVPFRELYIYICNQVLSDFFRAYHSNLF